MYCTRHKCSLSYKLNGTLNWIFHVTVTTIGSVPDVPDIPSSEAQSLSSYTPSTSGGDEVIWCFATQDICTDAPSVAADTLTMPTSTGVSTIDETATTSSGTPAISTGSTHGMSAGPTVSATTKRHCIFANRTSGVSHSPIQTSTSYRYSFLKFPFLIIQYCQQRTLLCKYFVDSWCPEE